MTRLPAAAYVRVSTEEQTDGWSLEGQETQIRAYAGQHGYEIVDVYRDETSGSKDKRPGLERMLMDAHAGRFKAVIVMHTSRLFRNIALARRYKDLLRNKLEIDVLFVNQPAMSPDDPMAFVLETFNELFDEYYLHQLRFWTTLGKKTRAEQGMWNGTLPFGYMTDESGMPVADPKNQEGLRLAFEAYSTDQYSDRGIAELLNRHGYRTTGNWRERKFTKDTVNPMLQNEFYLGFVKYKGEQYPGRHPALIDQALFDRCQTVRAGRRSKRRSFGWKKRVYILSGIARCSECGLTLRCHATQSRGEWRYYRHMAAQRGVTCPVPGKYVRADALEPRWGSIVARIKLPADWRERIEQLAADEDERETVLREREVVTEQLRRLKQLYADLLVDEGEYRTRRDGLRKRLVSLVLPENPQLIEAGELRENLEALWEAAMLAEKRDITRLLLEEMYVDVKTGTIVSIKPKAVFRLLLSDICADIGVEVL